MKYVIVALAVFASGAIADIDIENPLSEEFLIGGYIDFRYAQYGEYNTVPSREFFLKRAGLEAEATLTDHLAAELKVEARPDRIFLKDAFLSWEPLSFAQARFGQFKRETLLGESLSSWDFPMFDRPLSAELRENLTYGGRDLGIDVEVTLPEMGGVELRGIAGVFNGEENGDLKEDNELVYSFRGTAEILSPGITLGGSAVSQRLGTIDQSVPEGYTPSGRLTAFSGDVSIEHSFSNWYSGSLYGEYTTGDNWEFCDVFAGETAPKFKGIWGAITFNYHPWRVQSIRTLSLTVGFDEVRQDTDIDNFHRRISILASVYPRENIRLRFGGIRNTVSEILAEVEYTDLVAEAALRF